MKKLRLSMAVTALSFLFIASSFSQAVDYRSQAMEYIKSKYGFDEKAIGELKVKDQVFSQNNGVHHVHLVQMKNGYEIFGTEINLAFQSNGKISNVGHRLINLNDLKFSEGEVSYNAPQAIGIVASSFGIATRSLPELKENAAAGVPVYDKSDIGLMDIPVELGYLISNGEYRLTWKMVIEPKTTGLLYQSFVDATNGKLISNDNLTSHCSFENGFLSHENICDDVEAVQNNAMMMPPPVNAAGGVYRVLPLTIESPNHGAFQIVTGAEDLVASPYGWHDDNGANGAEYTFTRGNNVHAFLDRDWSYTPDAELDGGVNLTFDFPYNPAGEPVDNENVAVTSLFFRNNFMHDFTYGYGFNEQAGNFQQKNYTGALGGADYVNAHAQFGDNNPAMCGTETNGGVACQNNADFSTPPDGFNGRMRMFTWNEDNSSKFLEVLSPADLAGKIQTGLAQFGPDITSTAVTGPVVIIDDNSFNPSFGCNSVPTIGALEGKIAIIDRGLCDFSEKVFNAQEVGAIGVIICNFDETTIGMAAGDFAAQVTIPSVFISKSDCARIRIAAAQGLTASLVAPESSGPALRDGSLDNSVMSHEYGHGISTRLTGGPGNSSCLNAGATTGDAEEASGMGEGWSDFFALVTTVNVGDTGAKRRGIGTYSIKETVDGKGIRTYPYSTDLTVDPHTYDDIITEVMPHGVGSVWAAMLWDMYWDFVDQYGWDADVFHGTGGNNMAIQLVMDGLKLQPCPPGFVEARDAILEADELDYGGANQCLIWKAFARRGLGINADGGDPGLRADGKEGFELPTSCLDEIKFKKTMTPEIVAGQDIEVKIILINYKDFSLTNLFVEDQIPAGTSYIPGSANIAPSEGNSLVWSFDNLDPDQEITITYRLATDPSKYSIRLAYDDIEGDPLERWDITYDPDGETSNFWQTEDIVVHSGVQGWNVGDPASISQHYLQNLDPYHITGSYPLYRFYHYYDTEPGADGGFLEISTDGGDAWTALDTKVFRNTYPNVLQYGTFAIPNLLAFSGKSSDELTMKPVYVDLRDYIGESVKIRFRFGTDDNISGDGWYVDDPEVMDGVLYNSQACLTSDQTVSMCIEAPERGTIVDSQLPNATHDGRDDAALGLMPNPAGDIIQVVLAAKQSDDAMIHVFDLTGHMLITKNWNLASGVNQTVLDISAFHSGMYVVRVSTGDVMYSRKFVKE